MLVVAGLLQTGSPVLQLLYLCPCLREGTGFPVLSKVSSQSRITVSSRA